MTDMKIIIRIPVEIIYDPDEKQIVSIDKIPFKNVSIKMLDKVNNELIKQGFYEEE